MAEKRKLLGEIEKCYKKVEEGFEIFDDIMTKMNEANSENQREKFQDDLKKEIKKLQRLRDQIKGWQNSSDIKDKDSLIKFRKLIENRMELFKEIERENKTKPHSKQGLSIEDKLDPKEKEKFDTIEWLNTQIRRIQDEIDVTESKLEILTSSDGGRKRGGKKDDSKKNEKEVEELKKHLERVKYHSNNLEVCLRLITNEKLQAKDTMNRLKEPLEMYIDALDPENDEDPESYDPEDIYEELHLPMYISQLTCMTLGSMDDEKCQANDINKTPCGSPTSGGDHLQRHQSDDGSTGPQKSASAISTNIPIAPLKLTRLGSSQVSSEHSSLVSPLPQTPPLPGIPYNFAGKKLSSTTPEEIHMNNVDVQVLNSSKMDEFNNQLLALQGTYPLGCNGSCLGPNITDKKTIIPPLLGASPLGPVPIQGELEVQLNIVEAAISKVPLQMDSERQRAYLPKMPCQTPAYYPQVPLASVDSLDYYLRLSVETLFFIFYYMEGSRAQLLAAKALKKLSWRFHTKYLMWFQRHEEPKQITDDYEQGTYVYFDFEKWTQRKKEQFMFEYKYLEDKELPD